MQTAFGRLVESALPRELERTGTVPQNFEVVENQDNTCALVRLHIDENQYEFAVVAEEGTDPPSITKRIAAFVNALPDSSQSHQRARDFLRVGVYASTAILVPTLVLDSIVMYHVWILQPTDHSGLEIVAFVVLMFLVRPAGHLVALGLNLLGLFLPSDTRVAPSPTRLQYWFEVLLGLISLGVALYMFTNIRM